MTIRDRIYSKYSGLCAYSGKPLLPDWQIDHIVPKRYYEMSGKKGVNDFENLLPANRIVNHYKRDLSLEEFRERIKTLPTRLAKLPKRTTVKRTARRKEYLLEVAEMFDITLENGFKGDFYFETVKNK